MNDEDFTAAKLKGHNCLIKFIDGEILTLYVDESEDANHWWFSMESFLNDEIKYCPIPDFAVAKNTIKYVRKI